MRLVNKSGLNIQKHGPPSVKYCALMSFLQSSSTSVETVEGPMGKLQASPVVALIKTKRSFLAEALLFLSEKVCETKNCRKDHFLAAKSYPELGVADFPVLIFVHSCDHLVDFL